MFLPSTPPRAAVESRAPRCHVSFVDWRKGAAAWGVSTMFKPVQLHAAWWCQGSAAKRLTRWCQRLLRKDTESTSVASDLVRRWLDGVIDWLEVARAQLSVEPGDGTSAPVTHIVAEQRPQLRWPGLRDALARRFR